MARPHRARLPATTASENALKFFIVQCVTLVFAAVTMVCGHGSLVQRLTFSRESRTVCEMNRREFEMNALKGGMSENQTLEGGRKMGAETFIAERQRGHRNG